MSKKSFFKVLTETGPLIALGTALAILVCIAGPASAQFFNFPGFGGPPQRAARRRRGTVEGGRRLVRRRLLRAIPAATAASAAPGFFARAGAGQARHLPDRTCW